MIEDIILDPKTTSESHFGMTSDAGVVLVIGGPFWPYLESFWALFGPQNDLRSPKRQRGTYQNWQKGVKRPHTCVLGPF